MSSTEKKSSALKESQLTEIRKQFVPYLKKYGLWQPRFERWQNEDWSYYVKIYILDKFDYKKFDFESAKEKLEDELDMSVSIDVVIRNIGDQQQMYQLLVKWLDVMNS